VTLLDQYGAELVERGDDPLFAGRDDLHDSADLALGESAGLQVQHEGGRHSVIVGRCRRTGVASWVIARAPRTD
jgi:hypothetical protein